MTEEYNYICDKCNFKCKYKSAWDKHTNTELHKTGKRKQRNDIKEPFKCENCDYTTKHNLLIRQHILNEHSTIKDREANFRYYCSICDYGTFTKELYDRHINSIRHKKYIQRHNIC